MCMLYSFSDRSHSQTHFHRTQAADIILADDNFSTIVVAVAEGRKIYDNILKFIVYLLSCNLSEVILMLIAVAAGYPAPLNALQILYANIVSFLLCLPSSFLSSLSFFPAFYRPF